MGNVRIIEDEFTEIHTRTVDDRSRLTLGNLIGKTKRVQLCVNARGEILLRPVVEIPAAEHRLFHNRKALKGVKQGLKDAARGRTSALLRKCHPKPEP
ncbi:MAG: hypothetical protein HY673_14140 [Chloroflexi bacterium]|nr:hypothetical protein [Chloroflexota bacterium]